MLSKGRPFRDLSDQKVGRFTAQWFVGKKGHNAYWLCLCSCGNLRIVAASNLLKPKHSTSCGCLKHEQLLQRSTIHGHARFGRLSSEYHSWQGLKARCTNPKDEKWKHYGGRGIKVCAQWMQSFETFLADVGPKPSRRHLLDRINNNGNYEPGNCRWATASQSNLNRRPFRRNTQGESSHAIC